MLPLANEQIIIIHTGDSRPDIQGGTALMLLHKCRNLGDLGVQPPEFLQF